MLKLMLSGHEFSEGEQIARGRTVPWNTFAVWSIRELALTGFPLVGDGYPARDDAPAIPGGVEVRFGSRSLVSALPDASVVYNQYCMPFCTGPSER
jgi:hypothetical protein